MTSFVNFLSSLRVCFRTCRSVPRLFVGVIVVLGLVAGCCVGSVADADAQEVDGTPVVGSFNMGGGLSGGVEEQSGRFAMQVPLGTLPGVPFEVNAAEGDEGFDVKSVGGFDVGVSYRQDTGAGDRYGLGERWSWNFTFVDNDNGVRVFPTSGGAYEADASYPSGLAGYMLGDLVFSQETGVLPAREGVDGEVAYAYVLEAAGVGKDYFNMAGDLVARVGMFDERVDVLWEQGSERHLIGVVDSAGSAVRAVWDERGVEIISPIDGESDQGEGARTLLEISGGCVVSVVSPVGESVGFAYESGGLLERVFSDAGAVTNITYQRLPEGNTAVKRVRVTDGLTGEELSVREWKMVGEHNAAGWPVYQGSQELRFSGDGHYQYKTVLSDDVTDVVSTYNSLGLLVSRCMEVSTSVGDLVIREQNMRYEGVDDSGFFDPHSLSEQYSKPTETQAVLRDFSGRTRTVTERAEYNRAGQVVKQVGADGALTETVYDTVVPSGEVLPVGLVLRKTVTGVDGMISETVNTLTANRKAVEATETFVGHSGSVLESKTRTEFTVEADGFVSEKRVIAAESVSEGGAKIPQLIEVVGEKANANAGAGPKMVVTRFSRVLDRPSGVVVVSRTDAEGTDAQSTSSVMVGLATGHVVSETDPTGRVASTRYDVVGRVVSRTDLSGLSTTTQYGQRVSWVTDPAGIRRGEWVNAVGQVVKITNNVGVKNGVASVVEDERVVETRQYEDNFSKITTTDDVGRRTVSVSDVFGRVTRVSAPNGLTEVTEYDDIANTKTTGKTPHPERGLKDASQVKVTQKDVQGRDVQVTSSRSDGGAVPEQTTTYDGVGRVTEKTRNDVSTRAVLNADGTPRTETTTPTNTTHFPGENVTTSRVHDMLGVSTKKTLTQGTHTREGVSRVLDAAGQTISETDQVGNVTVFEYTVDGMVSAIHNGGTGVVVQKTYDPKTRALLHTETIASDGSRVVEAFEYDSTSGNLIEVYDPSDRAGTQVRHTYDVLGNRLTTSYPNGKTVTHVFNEHSQKLSTTDIDGNITRYHTDRDGALIRVTQTGADGTQLGTAEYTYDVYGHITCVKRGNGLETTYTYTSADEVRTEKTTHNGATIHEGSYEYDSHGNVTTGVDTRPATEDANASGDEGVNAVTGVNEGPNQLRTETTLYTYNAYDQLTTSAIYPGPTAVGNPRQRVEYEISVDGNVTKETTITPDETLVRQFEYNSLGQTTGVITNGERVPQIYDAAGNLIHSVDGTQYTYNLHNQPVTETHADGTTVKHTYWINGKRETLTTTSPQGTETVGLYWDEDTVINDTHTSVVENTPGGNFAETTASYLIGAFRHTRNLSVVSESSPAHTTPVDYYVTDRHGNTTSIVDAKGIPRTTYTYTDYGTSTTYTSQQQETTNTNTHTDHHDPAPPVSTQYNPFQYSSEYTTPIGTQLLGDRLYTAHTMAFTTKDTENLFNLYAYANANPINLIDPTGNNPQKIIDIIIKVTFGILFVGMILDTLFSLSEVLRATFLVLVSDISMGWERLLSLGVGTPGIMIGSIMFDIAAFNDMKEEKDRFLSEKASSIFFGVGSMFAIFSSVLIKSASQDIFAEFATVSAHLRSRPAGRSLIPVMGHTVDAAGEFSELSAELFSETSSELSASTHHLPSPGTADETRGRSTVRSPAELSSRRRSSSPSPSSRRRSSSRSSSSRRSHEEELQVMNSPTSSESSGSSSSFDLSDSFFDSVSFGSDEDETRAAY